VHRHGPAAGRASPARLFVGNENPGTLGAYLDGRAPTLVPAMAELVEEGQHRGEIRADQAAAALATILVYGVFAANRRQRVGPPFDVVTPLWQLAQEVILAGMRT
jgi:hypothetical protein